MKHKSTPRLYLVALTVSLLFVGFLYIKTTTKVNGSTKPLIHHKEVKDANQLEPFEFFYLDRNYPATEAAPNLYQQKLRQSILHDKTTSRSHRGLDAPWKIEGPGNIGGRVNTIAVHPLNPDIILLGYSQGGIYRTENGGIDWIPVFDDQVSLAISHITFDPHNPDRVYATTGDVNISGYPFLGSGIYRSDDAGLSWSNIGLNETGVLSKVAVDPANANIIYVGSMGYPSQKGIEKGFFRSIDGGQSWDKTLTIDDSTGIIDLVTDPVQPGRVFASGWTRIRSNKISTSIGPGTCLYRSEDYGATWENLVNELPGDNHSRTSVDISADGTLFMSYIGVPQNIDCSGYTESLKGLFKSNDGGSTWDTISTDGFDGVPCDLFFGFGWYFEVVKVNPENSLDISLLGVDMYRTLDGGQTWFPSAPPWWTYEVHADKHELVFAAGEMYLGTDGGVYKCPSDQSLPWVDMENIPSTQFYRTAFNPHIPDQYVGGAQDNGTSSGNANGINDWLRLFGGDGFQPLFDPTEPLWSYCLTQYGDLYWSQDDGNSFNSLGDGISGTSFWDMPLVMSSHDPKILFCGTNTVYRIDMRDLSPTWISISPDLTKGERLLGNRYPAITAIAQSDLDSNRLYAGTQDGLIWTTPDGGMNWTNITEGTPGNFVTCITPSTINPNVVFVTYSGYRDNDHTPYIFRSDNAGETWVPLGVNIPMAGVNNLYIFPGWNDEIIFVGTDGGVYVSFNSGSQWERLGGNFPYMPVYDVDFNPVENTIIAATFSRGLMTFPVDELDLVSAVDPIDPQGEFVKIYPTIVKDFFTISVDANNDSYNKNSLISIINQNGAVIQTASIELNEVNKVVYLEPGIPPGLYYVKLQLNSRSVIHRIIVEN